MTSNGSGKYNNPSFQVARLFRKKSEKGNTYFVGRWGGARVLLLKSKDVADDGSEIWSLMLAEAPPPKAQQAAQDGAQQPERQPAAGDDSRRDYARPSDRQDARREPEQRRQAADDDDAIPF